MPTTRCKTVTGTHHSGRYQELCIVWVEYYCCKCIILYHVYTRICLCICTSTANLTHTHTHIHTHTHTHTHTLKGSITLAVSGAATVTMYLNSKCMYSMYVSACTVYFNSFSHTHAHTHTHTLWRDPILWLYQELRLSRCIWIVRACTVCMYLHVLVHFNYFSHMLTHTHTHTHYETDWDPLLAIVWSCIGICKLTYHIMHACILPYPPENKPPLFQQ